MDLTLNAFRAVLGKVNDGNVVFKEDQGRVVGLRKVNFGWNCREAAESDPAVNRRVREAFLNALSNSPEARQVGEAYIRYLRVRLLGTESDATLASTPLDRRTIQTVIAGLEQTIADSVGSRKDGLPEAFVRMTDQDLRAAGMFDRRIGDLVRRTLCGEVAGGPTCFRSRDTMKEAVGAVFKGQRTFNGFTKAEMMKFVDNNAARLEMLAYDRLYLEAYDELSAHPDVRDGKDLPLPQDVTDILARADGGRTLLLSIIDDVMADYAEGREPRTRIAGFVKGPRGPAEPKKLPDEGSRANLTTLQETVRMLLPLADLSRREGEVPAYGRTLERRQQNEFANPILQHLETALSEALEGQKAADPRVRKENALNAFRQASPLGARLLDAHDMLAAMGERDRAAFARIFAARLRSALDGVDLRGGTGCGRLAEAMAGVLEGMTMADRTRDFVGQVVRRAQQVHQVVLPDDANLDGLVDSLVREGFRGPSGADWLRVRGAFVMKALCPDSYDGPRTGTGFAEYDRLLETVASDMRRSLEGPGVRQNLLKKIGAVAWAAQMLPREMRVSLGGRDNFRPVDENASLLAGKIGFLRIVNPPGALQRMGILNTSRTLVTGAGAEAALAKIDEQMAKWTNEDIARTVSYVTSRLAEEDEERVIFNLINDGQLKAEDVTHASAYVFTMIGTNGCGVAGIGNHVYDGDADTAEKNRFGAVVRSLAEAFDYPLEIPETLTGDDCNNLLRGLYEANVFGPSASGGISLPRPDVVRLMSSCGIRMQDLTTPLGLARYLLMYTALCCRGGNPDGLAAWLQRTTGYDLRTISFVDMPNLAAKMSRLKDGDLPDPIEDGASFPAAIVQLLDGRAKISDAKLAPEGMRTLMDALAALAAGGGNGVSPRFRLGGCNCQLRTLSGGRLEATLFGGGNAAYKVDVPRSADDFRAQLVTKIATEPNAYAELVPGILPRLGGDGLPEGMSVSRARELCVKILVAKLKCPSVAFATFGLPELVKAAGDAIDGRFTVDDLPKDLPTRYNAADIAAVQQAYVNAGEAELEKIRMPAPDAGPSEAERRRNPPDDQTVHELVSELFLNRDTSVFDRDAETPGLRLQKLRKAYGPELSHFASGDAVAARLTTFPTIVREMVGTLLNRFIALEPTASAASFAAFEKEIEAAMEEMMAVLQDRMVNPLFALSRGEAKEEPQTWTRSLDELTGVDGLDEKTPNGKFVRAVLGNYFKEAAPTEKRAMLAAYLRNVRTRPSDDGKSFADPSAGFQVGELMKGAGPVFQKMLQGLPIESFGPETRKALQDMKSALSPIPEPVVRAMLLDLVRSSNGNILSIDVRRTIGCATVGQAILCHIKTKEHPYSGEDVVIKLLRPNVQTAALRERARLVHLAERTGGKAMVEMFEAQFKGILEELDFTREAENVDVAFVQYNRPKGPGGTDLSAVRCMRRIDSIPPTPGVLVLEKVKGDTLDRQVRAAREDYDRIVSRLKGRRGDGGEVRIVWEGPDVNSAVRTRRELDQLITRLMHRRAKLEQVVTNWVDTAIFKDSGFLHGDLHPGNLMSDEKSVTYIDFGNVHMLTEVERKGIGRLFISAGFGDGHLEGEKMFLEAIRSMMDAAGQAALDAVKDDLASGIRTVLAKGRSDNLVARLLAALALVQRKGLALPPGLNAFMQSLARLQAAVKEIDGLVDDCEVGILKVQSERQASEDFLAKLQTLKGRIPGIDVFEQVVRNAVRARDFGAPADVKNVFQEMIANQKQLKSGKPVFAGFEGVDPFRNDERHLDNDLSAFKTLFELLSQLRATSQNGTFRLLAVGGLQRCIDRLEKLLSTVEAERPTTWAADVDAAKRELLVQTFEALEEGRSSLLFMPEVHRRNTFEEIVGSCFVANAAALQKQQGGLTAITDLGYFARGTLFLDAHHARAERLAVEAADRANARLDANQRVGIARARQLVAAARDFQLPGGTLSGEAIGREDLKTVLRVNVAAVRKRLGLAPEERLSPGEIQYLATYFVNRARVSDTLQPDSLLKRGLLVGKIGLAVTKVGDDIGNTRAVLGAYEAKYEGSHPVAEAVRGLDAEGLRELETAFGGDADVLAFVRALREAARPEPVPALAP